MKKLLLALLIAASAATPGALAQTTTPVASGVPTPDTLAAANDLLESMNYRSVVANMFGQMRRSLPAMMQQGIRLGIDNNAKLDAVQKQIALDKVNREMPKAVAMFDTLFNDVSVLDEMMQETAKLYARTYTVDELHQIAVFYKSPVGAKVLASMPQVVSEGMQIGQRIAASRVAEILKKVQAN